MRAAVQTLCTHPCCPALHVPPPAMVALMYFILLAGIIKDGFCPETDSVSHPWGQAKFPAPAVLGAGSPRAGYGGRCLSHPSLQEGFLYHTLDNLVMETPALAGAGGPGRCHTPDRDSGLVLSWCQGSHTPKPFSPGAVTSTAPHCTPTCLGTFPLSSTPC